MVKWTEIGLLGVYWVWVSTGLYAFSKSIPQDPIGVKKQIRNKVIIVATICFVLLHIILATKFFAGITAYVLGVWVAVYLIRMRPVSFFLRYSTKGTWCSSWPISDTDLRVFWTTKEFMKFGPGSDPSRPGDLQRLFACG